MIRDLRLRILIVLLFASLPIAVFGGLALAFICAGSAAIALTSVRNLDFRILAGNGSTIILVGFVVLLGWSLVTLQWTLNEKAALSVWIRAILLISSSGVLMIFAADMEKNLTLERFISYGFILALALAFFEYITDGLIIRTIESFILGHKEYIPKISNMDRGACYLSLMFWAAAAYFRDDRKKFAILWLATLIVLTRLVSLSADMGFLAGTAAFIFVHAQAEKKFDLPITAVLIFIIIAFPIINLFTNPPAIGELHILPLSSLHRLYIWQFSMGKIMEHPLLGWGFDASPFIPGGHDLIAGRSQDYWRYLPLHTHNSIIQLWLELGILGPILLAVIFAGAVFAVRKSSLPVGAKASLTAIIIGYFTIGLTGFGIWQFWWIGAGFLSLAAMLAASYNIDSSASASLQKS